MFLPYLLFLFLLLGDATASEVVVYKIHHRIPPADFSLRATVTLRNEDGVERAFYQTERDEGSSGLTFGSEGNYYQIALERPSDASPEDWSFVSAKACHISHRTSDALTLVINGNGDVIHLNYHILDIPRDGSCPASPPIVAPKFFNTTVIVKHPNPVPTPMLRSLPPMTPEGQPVVPPPEKSFIQKYWIYAAPLLLILLLSPEEEARSRT